MEWSAEHVRRVQEVEFGRQRGGYDVYGLDNFLDHVAAAMERGIQIPDPREVFLASASRFTFGYDRQQVDRFLSILQSWRADAEQRERDRAAAAEQAAARATRAATTATPELLRWTPQQIAWVRDIAFTGPDRGDFGYDRVEVDTFLNSVLRAMGDGRALPDIDFVVFTRAPRRTGYDAREVDVFLDHLSTLRPLPPVE